MSASSGRNSSSRAWPGAFICIVTWTLRASALERVSQCHGTHMVAEMGEAALRGGEWDGVMHVAERGRTGAKEVASVSWIRGTHFDGDE
jgi:hypothetical protein